MTEGVNKQACLKPLSKRIHIHVSGFQAVWKGGQRTEELVLIPPGLGVACRWLVGGDLILLPPCGSGTGKHMLLGSLSWHLIAYTVVSRFHAREATAQWCVCVCV